MTAIPQPTNATVAAMYSTYEESQSDSRRSHLGASQIGHPCERQLWYGFRWAKQMKHRGQLLRLFQTGHLEEPRMINDLRAAGVQVLDVDPSTGRQWGARAADGHFGGSADGAGLGIPEAPRTWHLLEFKTHGQKSFKDLEKKGSVELSKPEHAAQMQIYMHLLGLKRALYLAKNKNTDELYSERIKYDKAEAERLLLKAERIIKSEQPPERAFSADYYLCKWCDYKEQCHEGEFSERNCRTCLHSTPINDGQWSCGESKDPWVIPESTQRVGCSSHRYIPGLVPHTQLDIQDGVIVYQGYQDRGPA